MSTTAPDRSHVDAFDADVLVYAAIPAHPRGEPVRRLLTEAHYANVRIGSTLLIPEVLTKPRRLGADRELEALETMLGTLELIACDETVAAVSVTLGARYGLRPQDSVHLATAVVMGAQRFVTNNRLDFPRSIDVVEVTYPEDLP